MTLQLRKAERKKAKLRIGVFGPSGSGKTMSALKMARGITDWEKIAVIDTENQSADLYSNLGPYNVMTLEAPFTPEKYIEAITACESAGIEVIIVDSITHEWAGPGGILEIADQLGKDARNSFAVWGKLTPRHNKFINKILFTNAHVICCGRSKQDYVLNQVEKNGKVVNIPEKTGLKAITREGFDYEMTVSFDLSISHLAISTKDRTGIFQDKVESVISEETGKKLIAWANSGAQDLEADKLTIKHLCDSINPILTSKADYETLVKKVTQLDLNDPKNYEEIINRLTITKQDGGIGLGVDQPIDLPETNLDADPQFAGDQNPDIETGKQKMNQKLQEINRQGDKEASV